MLFAFVKRKRCIRPLLIHAWHTRIVIDFARINFPDSINRFHPGIFLSISNSWNLLRSLVRNVSFSTNNRENSLPIAWYRRLCNVILLIAGHCHSNREFLRYFTEFNELYRIIMRELSVFRMIVNIHREFLRVQVRIIGYFVYFVISIDDQTIH